MKKDTKFTCKIFLPNTLVQDKDVDGYMIATYAVLQRMHTISNDTTLCVDLYNIHYALTNEVKINRRTYERLTEAINKMVDNNTITLLDNEARHYIIDCSNLYVDTKNTYFTMITFDEVRKIMNIEGFNSYSLLKYFAILINSISNAIYVGDNPYDKKTRTVGNMAIQWLSERSGISEQAIIEYNKVLEKNKLIYINRSDDFYLNDMRQIKRMRNCYGRYEDKELVDEYADSQKRYNNTYKFSKEANYNRRCAQIYHQIVKGNAHMYSLQEIKNSYDYIWAKNDYYEELYKNTRKEEYKEKIRDMSIYDPFDFSEVL